MRLFVSKARLYVCIALLFLFAICAASNAFAGGPPKRELVWSQPENEISTPQFSDDGNFIVLVTRVHWPDGHEAENLPEDYFKKLEKRKQEDPRFADPVIRLIDLKGNQVCEIRYGTNPTVSSDNKTIVFSRQRKPLTGLRTLAETLDGNDIQAFDCEKKQGSTIAQPTSGYLDNPIFLRDRKSIAYTRNEATNGAFGGPVGLEEVDFSTGQKATVLAKQTMPAVPCPKEPSKSPVEAFMCAHVKPSSAFPNLLLGFARTTDEIVVLLGKPVPSPGDSYLARRYDLSLVSPSARGGEVLSLGRTEMQNLRDFSIQESSGDNVLVRSKYWKTFSMEKRDWLPETLQKNTNPRSLYSPNLNYYVTPEPAEDPDHFTLRQASDGQVLFTSPGMEAVYGATWSRDSKRFAIVGVPKQTSGLSYREELAVYSIP